MKKFLLTFAFAFSILFFNKTNGHASIPSNYILACETDQLDVYVINPNTRLFMFTNSDGWLIWQTGFPQSLGTPTGRFNWAIYRHGTDTRVSTGSGQNGNYQFYGNILSTPLTYYFDTWDELKSARNIYDSTGSYNPTSYVSDIGWGCYLSHSSEFLNTGNVIEHIVWDGGKDCHHCDFEVYRNGAKVYSDTLSNGFLGTGIFRKQFTFDYDGLGILDGDEIIVKMIPKDIDDNWGNTNEIRWFALTSFAPNGNIDIPYATPQIEIPSIEEPLPVNITENTYIVYQGVTNTVISTNTTYSQNINTSNITNLDSTVINNYIVDNSQSFGGDTITQITNNNNYYFHIEWGDDPDGNVSSFIKALPLFIDAIVSFILGIKFLPKILFTCLTVGFGFLTGVIALVFLKR